MSRHIQLDRFAIILSGLCALHCIVLPIVAALIPILTTTLLHGYDAHDLLFHEMILFMILPVSIFALISGFNCHKTLLPALIVICGLSVLLIPSLFFDILHDRGLMGHTGEVMVTLTGGLIHAYGHFLNIQSTRHHNYDC